MAGQEEKSTVPKVVEDAPSAPIEESPPKWTVLVVEDDDQYRAEISEAIESRVFADFQCKVISATHMNNPLVELAIQSVDLAIIDLRQDSSKNDEAGITLLERQKSEGWGPIIVYSAYADRYRKEHETRMARFITKAKRGEGLAPLIEEIEKLFENGLPQVKHAVTGRLKHTVGEVIGDGDDRDFVSLCEGGDFGAGARVIARRIASAFGSTKGLQSLSADVGQTWDGSDGAIVPEEFYIRPPLEDHLTTGSVVQDVDGKRWVVLNAACDLVPGQGTGGGCKVGHVVMVPTEPWPTPAVQSRVEEFARNGTKVSKHKNFVSKIENQRVQEWDYGFDYYLPGAFGEDGEVLSFSNCQTIPIDELNANYDRIQTIDYPFVNDLVQRFTTWFGRVGIPKMNTVAPLRAFSAAVDAAKAPTPPTVE